LAGGQSVVNKGMEKNLDWQRRLERLAPASGALPVARQACVLGESSSCPVCKGRGWFAEAEGAQMAGRVCACVKQCSVCLGRAQIVENGVSRSCRNPPLVKTINLYTAAAIPPRYGQASLATFSNNAGNGAAVVSQLRSWVTQFKAGQSQGFVLGGPVGVGKTYLLAGIARALADKGVSVRFCDFFQLLGDLKSGYSDGKADPAVLEPLIDVDVLIIDELGKGRNTEWEKTIADSLICGRYNRGKIIVASTNFKFQERAATHQYNIDLERDLSGRSEFSPDQFGSLESRVGQRVFSRLREMTAFIELTGPDFRKLSSST
jgi:DNA replication protein DnaC